MKPIKLIDLIDSLSTLDDEMTIYFVEPWTNESLAIIALEPEAGGLPEEAAGAEMTYFLEISLAKQFIKDWISMLEHDPSPSEICSRIIRYAKDDA